MDTHPLYQPQMNPPGPFADAGQDDQLVAEHRTIAQARLDYLQSELRDATKECEDLSREIETFLARSESLKASIQQRTEEMEHDYEAKIDDHSRQIRLAEELLQKRKAEQETLLEYLRNLNLKEQSDDDLRNFNWQSIKKVAENGNESASINAQFRKAAKLIELNRIARARFNEIYELLSATKIAQNRCLNKSSEIKSHISSWLDIKASQEKKLSNEKKDNERLNLLIKQCALNTEPMSEYVTKNVRAKYHSFMHSEDPKELINGLQRYRYRQEHIIRLLKHRETTLVRDINLLQVAADQTADQMQYYEEIIKSNRDVNLNQQLTSATNGDYR